MDIITVQTPVTKNNFTDGRKIILSKYRKKIREGVIKKRQAANNFFDIETKELPELEDGQTVRI